MQNDKWKGLSMTERWKDPEWREYHSKLMSLRKGKKIKGRSEESKKRTSESIKKWHRNMKEEDKENLRKRISEGIQNLPPSKLEARNKKISEGVKRSINEDPGRWEEIQNKATAGKRTDSYREKRRAGIERRVKKIKSGEITPLPRKPISEKARKNMSEAGKLRYANMTPEQRKKSEAHKQKISEGVSRSILEGKGSGYFKSSKRGTHQSPKVGPVYYRSNYELIAFKLLDKDTTVESYRHDAVRVPYKMDGKNRYFIIDLEITYKDNRIKYVEVKPEDFLSDPCNQLKIAAAQNKFGTQFEVWSERELGISDKFAIYGK